MKNQVFAIFALFILSAPAAAQIEIPQIQFPGATGTSDVAPLSQSMPVLTKPDQVAMIYYKLAGKEPPYVRWAEADEEYKKASDFDKTHIREMLVSQLKDVYNLSLIRTPLVIETPVTLSPYSFRNKGFLIESFSAETFFPFSYSGDAFAVVVASLMDFQWISVPEEVAMKMDTAQTVAGGALKMILHAESASAEKSGALVMAGQPRFLMSARLSQVQIFDPATNGLLWQQDFREQRGEEAPDPKLLNLYSTNN